MSHKIRQIHTHNRKKLFLKKLFAIFRIHLRHSKIRMETPQQYRRFKRFRRAIARSPQKCVTKKTNRARFARQDEKSHTQSTARIEAKIAAVFAAYARKPIAANAVRMARQAP